MEEAIRRLEPIIICFEKEVATLRSLAQSLSF